VKFLISTETNMEGETLTDEAWFKAQKAAETALSVLKLKRAQLQPVFNPEDSTELSIEKQIRGELLIEELRDELSDLVNATKAFNTSCTFEKQRQSLVALGCLGELLVREYPYKVPYKGKFSFLPRLLGRAKVTFFFKRDNKMLGNITIMADGYTAPITAGNFVDLCLRNFYTGLPVRAATKRFGPPSDQESATVNILGSFGEGFYDPLTAKLRRIPLEIIRLEQGSGQPKLSYSTRGLSDTSLMAREDANLRPSMTSKPLLKFDTPGMLAWNHNENDPNGGSSEFFGLGPKSLPEDKRRILDGDYAPFGFIIRGYDLFLSLKPGDIIDSTVVDSFGRLNLVKIRESNFQQAAQGLEVVNQEK
jgi:peptidylprolyl isomerase